MNEDETERRFHTQRKAGRTYISRPRRGGGGHMRYRYVRRVVDATAPAEFRSVADETVLNEEKLKQLFSQYGEVEDAKMFFGKNYGNLQRQ